MTPGQWKVLREIVGKTETAASNVNRRTAEALTGHGFIEDCPRMYFGPRTHRYRATELGRQAVEKADAKLRKRMETKRGAIHAPAGNPFPSADLRGGETPNPADRPKGGA